MVLRDEILRRIEKKSREINDLDVKIKAAMSYLQALEDLLKVLSEDDKELRAPVPQRAEGVLRSGSKTDRVRDILRAAGEPMHISRLLEALGEKADTESRAALAGSLGAYARDGKIFNRPAPNTFGLMEFDNPNARAPSSPPPGFGLDTPQEPEPVGDDDVPF